ncbi:hypothetical protein BRD56_05030 [Thermoplasmatales archaeon SW_10_69_26]|nr:MAG: hypothetical protein BRD56_05030 [Thermoplasmatales archaeon SW_10_69_26]
MGLSQRRKVGLVLLGVGSLVLVATLLLAPPPQASGGITSEAETDGIAEDDLRVAARQPQLGDGIATRYDPQVDVTYTVFGAGHGYDKAAFPLEGDRRGELDSGPFILAQTTQGPVTVEPLDPGVALSGDREQRGSVNQTLSATFDTASPGRAFWASRSASPWLSPASRCWSPDRRAGRSGRSRWRPWPPWPSATCSGEGQRWVSSRPRLD